MVDINQLNKFQLNQKMLSLDSKYYVFNEMGQPIFYVDRPVLRMKVDMGIYADESKTHRLYSIRTKKILQFPTSEYYLYDNNDMLLAVYQKSEIMGILRSSWNIYSDEGMTNLIARVDEDSWGKALIRRFVELGSLLKTDFHIFAGETQIGAFIRKLSLGDKYTMDLTADTQKRLDRRIALGLSLVLDIGEGR